MTIEQSIKSAEAIIFASGDGVAPQRLMDVLGIDEKMLGFIISTLKDKYDDETSGVILVHNTEMISFETSPETADDVKKAMTIKRSNPLSDAAMETLAVIAYNQPVSRAFIEQVRGVDSTSSVQTLVTRGLIEEAGRLEIPGNPIAYRTTPLFLRSFSIDSLADLPKVKADDDDGQMTTDGLAQE